MHIWDTIVSHCTQTAAMRYFFLEVCFMTNNVSRTRILTECAIMVALASVLSMVKLWQSPYGGSVTCLSMVPIILLSLRRGVKTGLLAGFAHGIIQLLLGLSNLTWIPSPGGIVLCALTDYILPFTLLGLGGLFRNCRFSRKENTNLMIGAVLGALLVTLLRYLSHIVSGAVIWYSLDLEWYADDASHIVNQYGAWAFSVIYNGIYMVPEILATTVATPLLAGALKRVN